MKKNIKIATNEAVNTFPAETKSEYKIGHTTYTVVTKFNTCGESLNDILTRLIKKDIEAIA